jgi:hypothetical protein
MQRTQPRRNTRRFYTFARLAFAAFFAAPPVRLIGVIIERRRVAHIEIEPEAA